MSNPEDRITGGEVIGLIAVAVLFFFVLHMAFNDPRPTVPDRTQDQISIRDTNRILLVSEAPPKEVSASQICRDMLLRGAHPTIQVTSRIVPSYGDPEYHYEIVCR